MSKSRTAALYRLHFREPHRERAFLASVSFFVVFFLVRALTHAIRAGMGPFHDLSIRGTHVHHLVWGILILLLVGYLWLLQVGVGHGSAPRWVSNVTAVLFGVGAALTLDEFALWLRLEDVYWEREGRWSVDAVSLFGGLLLIGVWGGPFFRALGRDLVRRFRSEPS
jgi:hypothetical protein